MLHLEATKHETKTAFNLTPFYCHLEWRVGYILDLPWYFILVKLFAKSELDNNKDELGSVYYFKENFFLHLIPNNSATKFILC